MMFGGARDISLKRTIARSFINKTVSQEVIYYKLSLSETTYDIYGDSKKKMYMQPTLITCIVNRQPQESDNIEMGVTTNRLIDFAFLKDDLIDINLVPEKGDIIVWNESYYEVDLPVENQLIVGKDSNYSLQSGLEEYGRSWSIICQCFLTSVNRLNIIEAR